MKKLLLITCLLLCGCGCDKNDVIKYIKEKYVTEEVTTASIGSASIIIFRSQHGDVYYLVVDLNRDADKQDINFVFSAR